MRFNPKKVGFGRHETFALRYSWLTKGIKALSDNPSIFNDEDATVTLGVGKNMVNAIRYWLLASRLIEPADKGFKTTAIGEAIFGVNGYDEYLEDEATIWLIHWLIASNSEQATAWFWFFNSFHKPEFETGDVVAALLDFTEQKITTKCAATTVEKDAAMVLRMYARARGNTRTPLEDTLDSPLIQLRLITQSSVGRGYSSVPAERDGLPIGIFGYVVADLFNELGASELPIEDLMYSKAGHPSPGAIFRLTENALLTKLEKLVTAIPGIFEVRESAGIHQVYLLGDGIDPMGYLAYHYQGEYKEMVA
ncbi:DUF4007 family protein [Sedimenticola hydrogenitrophicus]|uniref:DUF4007 family protein n=1 Tax=Sedimenticola hydrogenitrophicus TaxID=2967975 RepID=UPI0021A3DB9E|nr:DUF4007 family protein [Sedimenticola hydrogenitrophicus]